MASSKRASMREGPLAELFRATEAAKRQKGDVDPAEALPPETDSEQRSVASFDLPAGKYRLWCSLPEHEEKGMETILMVE